jgi:hypothetical protein
LDTEVTPQMINEVLGEFKEEGAMFAAEEQFDAVYDFLIQRYANINQFNEDSNQSDIGEFYRNLILSSVDANMDPDTLDLIITSLSEKDFKNLKCK